MPLEVQWPLPNLNQPSKLWQLGSSMVVPAVGILAKLFHGWFNTVNVYNKEVLFNAIENRPKDVPLITVCNHHSCLDDPFIWGEERKSPCVYSLMKYLRGLQNNALGQDLNPSSLEECVPPFRWHKVHEIGADKILTSKQNIHCFLCEEAALHSCSSCICEGVGRLIAESKKCPIVIPFWHVGMNNVLPNKEPYVPHWGQMVTILIGDPIDFSPLRDTMKKQEKSAMEQRKAITDTIQEEFGELKSRAETLHQLSLPSC
ncbi:phosphate acyltransferase, putative [Ixodes scapularis]|uniref:Tafazzin family protein n=1 Tax=Ixodes scapularis TaxID=6945 RepID=B7P9J6_IXOSC|nr:phosphate acyltransferase, putative [Ixodes scapularis]|eukprot:XP_002404536.1 phosphate acyltransferase, putative [Ixodes scapularis]